MGFKVKKPSPPSVKSAVKAVQKAAPRPASNAAKSVRSASSNAKKGASSIARGAQRMSKAAKPTPAKAAKAIKENGGKVQALAAEGTRIRYNADIRRAGVRDRINRINSRNTSTIRKLDPGRYVVRQRNPGKPSLHKPEHPPRFRSVPPGMVLKAAESLISQANISDGAIKNVSRVAKMAGGGVSGLAAKGTQITRGVDLPRIGSGDRRKRINTRNTTTMRRLTPGRYVVRDRLRPSSGGLPKSPAARNLLNKAKKTFSNPGKPIAKAVKSPKKALSKKIKAASKAKVQFPKNVKGPKATCPLLKQKGLKQSNAMFKAPKLSTPKSKVTAGVVIGGAIGAMVGGLPGAVIGAAIGAGVAGNFGTVEPPRRTIKKRPDYSPANRAGKPQPGNKAQRQTASTSAAVYPGQQSYSNCAVQSCAQLIAQATGKLPKEKELLKSAIENGWSNFDGETKKRTIRIEDIKRTDGGTDSNGQQAILKAHGIGSKSFNFEDFRNDWQADVTLGTSKYLDVLGDAIWNGKGVIATIHTDSASWWKDKDGRSRGQGYHAFCVVDGDFDKDGNLTHVYLTDTGVGKPEIPDPPQPRPGPLRVSIDDYMKATKSVLSFHQPMELVVTDNKIWP